MKRLVRWMLKEICRLVETSYHARSQPSSVAMSPLPERVRSLGLEQVHKHNLMTSSTYSPELFQEQLSAPAAIAGWSLRESDSAVTLRDFWPPAEQLPRDCTLHNRSSTSRC